MEQVQRISSGQTCRGPPKVRSGVSRGGPPRYAIIGRRRRRGIFFSFIGTKKLRYRRDAVTTEGSPCLPTPRGQSLKNRLKAMLCLEERGTAKWRSGWLELATNHPVVLLHSWKVGKTGLQTNVLSFDEIVYPFHICHFIGPAGRLSLSSWLGTPTPPLYPRCAPTAHRPHHTRARNLHFHFAAERLSAGDKQALFTPFCSCEGPVFFHRRHSPKRFTCRWGVWGGSPLEAKWHGGVWFPHWKRASVDVSGNALNQRGSVKKSK